MKNAIGIILLILAATTYATEFHVATNGIDSNDGSPLAPLRTIQHAADLAQPGDTVTVHAGVYREQVNPPRGGDSDAKRITYQVAPGEKVTITGSEPVKNWIKVQGDIWKATLPNALFGRFNPYSDLIHGDWFDNNNRFHHTGAVYLNGEWMDEAKDMSEILKAPGSISLWFASVDIDTTRLFAVFRGLNPNEQNVEINVRRTVFTPSKVGINYITIRGFDLRDAATNWAPPTAGQIGLITAYWCKGWIIENNEISYSKCSGVSLGKYSDELDNKSASAEGYVGTIQRALANGWNKETVGSHIVRNNQIHHCEQTGIVGSLGCAFSTIEGNEIHDIHVRNLFGGAEMAGIKFHGAIDVIINHNHIYHCGNRGGIWLDWMAQGAQVTRNLIHDCNLCFFFEMQHGPILVANNLLLSDVAINSQGIAFAHNLFSGSMGINLGDGRVTPFQEAHSTKIVGMYPDKKGDSGDYRFYNNIFCERSDLSSIDKAALTSFAAGNIFLKGAKPSKFDKDTIVKPDCDSGVRLKEKPDGWYLSLTVEKSWCDAVKRAPVTTALLGNAKVSNCAFENPDGTPLKMDTDYLGKTRSATTPTPGPFENLGIGPLSIKVWQQ